MKKSIVSVLSVFVCAWLLSSCALVPEYTLSQVTKVPASISTTSLEITEPQIPQKPNNNADGGAYNPQTQLSILPEANFQSQYFTVIVPEKNSSLFPADEEYISASAYERNRLAETKYNVKIVETAMSSAQLTELAESSELAGSYYADLLALPVSDTALFYEKGLIEDFAKKPFFVEDRPYFDSEINARLNENYDGTYALYCDTLVRPQDCYVLFCNKKASTLTQVNEEWHSLVEASAFADRAQTLGCVLGGDADPFNGAIDYFFSEEKSASDLFVLGEVAFCVDKISSIEKFSGAISSLAVAQLPLPQSGNAAFGNADELQVFCFPKGAASDKCTVLVTCALGGAGCDNNMKLAIEHYREYVQDNRSAVNIGRIFSDFALFERKANVN